MKTNKVTKLGVSLLSVAALGVVAPSLIDTPIFGIAVVKAEEQQEPLKFRITYYDNEAGKILGQMTGIINPGETINIYKNIDGYEITFKEDWMPNYVLTWDIVNEYFYRSADGYDDLYLNYKKLEPAPTPNPAPTPTPKPEVTPEPKPSETPKPEVKPEPKPSETPKPEVKPEPAPKDEETRPLEYRIVYYDKDTGEEIAPPKIGTINPGEIVNIHKDIDGYQVVSNYDEWMPGFNASYRIMSEYFGFSKGRLFMFLDYKKLDADAKPSDTPKPEVKSETKPSETPKPEVKPEPKPSETPKPEVKPAPAPKDEEKQEPLKYRITYYDIETREMLGQMTGVISPGQTINIYKKFNGHEIISKDEWMPNYGMTYDIVNEYFYGSADGYNDLRLEYKKLDADAKPSDTSKPEVKPEPKPSETPKPEVKPEPKPSETPKPEVKPETKPSDTPKPEVKPAPKPSDTSKPEVKPELKPQTNSNTAPTVPVKPVGQTSNSKADKPTSKKETPALPNTGEQSSSLSLFGLLLASIGLAGLTYKGRH